MLWTTTNPRPNNRITSTRHALNVVYERLTLDTSAGLFVKTPDRKDLNLAFISSFNKGDSIYRADEPFASLVTDTHKVVEHCVGDNWKEYETWPLVFDKPTYYLKEEVTGELIRIEDNFGPSARSVLSQQDIDSWILFWCVVDIVEGLGSCTVNNDSRVPSRDMFIPAYAASSWPDDTVNSLSALDLDNEIRSTLAPRLGPTKQLRKMVEPWIDAYPDSLYSVKFKGRFLQIDRHSDLNLTLFHAQKENHPFWNRFKDANLS